MDSRCGEEAPGAVDRAKVDGGGRIARRGVRGEEQSNGGLGVVLGGCSRWKRSRGSGVAVLRAREGERSSLRALCSVERLDAEWAGEVAEAALRGGEPSSNEDAPRAGGEASPTLVGRGDSRGVKARGK